MSFKNKILILIFSLSNLSFSLIDGQSISLEKIISTKNERILFIFSSGVSCKDCYYWLAQEIYKIQNKFNIKVYIVSEYKENVFQRKIHSSKISKNLRTDLKETYIFDEEGNAFIRHYMAFYCPSILFFYQNSEDYLPYQILFENGAFNQKALYKIIK